MVSALMLAGTMLVPRVPAADLPRLRNRTPYRLLLPSPKRLSVKVSTSSVCVGPPTVPGLMGPPVGVMAAADHTPREFRFNR